MLLLFRIELLEFRIVREFLLALFRREIQVLTKPLSRLGIVLGLMITVVVTPILIWLLRPGKCRKTKSASQQQYDRGLAHQFHVGFCSCFFSSVAQRHL